MNQLTLILVLSTIMWYVIDNLKENIWGGLSYSRHITILVAAIVGFVLPAALVMCRRYIVASVMSVIGFIGILVVYSGFSDLYQYTKESTGPTELYMPCIFITIIIILITILEKSKLIKESIENHNKKKNAVAPSIFGDNKK